MLTLDRHLTEDDLAQDLRADTLAGLTSSPKELLPKYFYDARGSALFEDITRLPEYYPTRAERSILTGHADEIATAAGADTLLELGSGSSEKTRLLLDALGARGELGRYVAVDVSESALTEAGASVAADYPGVAVHGVVADFERHLRLLPTDGRRMIAFLGGTIGNLPPDRRGEFLSKLRSTMHAGDSLLLGTDLVKDERRLVRAYDDESGVTAQFNRNILHVVNHALGADFDPELFGHVAIWDREHEWIEMRLRSAKDQVVDVAGLGLQVEFAAGEELRTEISAKFRRDRVAGELATAGLRRVGWWTDPDGDFALSLAVPAT